MHLKRAIVGLLALGGIWFAGFEAAHAQPSGISQKVGVCDVKTPTNCIKPNSDGSVNVSGSISSSTTATASATPTPVVAGTGKPLNIGLFSNLFMTPVTPTGTQIDLSLPSGILCLDGVTICSAANPLPVVNEAQADTVMIGGVNVKEIAGVAPTQKAASTAPATTDTAFVVAQSPVPALACNAKVVVNITASTDLVTFTNTGYICSIILVGAAAESWGLVDGTGTVCATGIAGVLGGTTGTLAFAANGGFSSINDRPWLFTSGSGKHLCLLKSGAGNISGVITYRDF